jgi:spore germination protein KA
MHDNKGPSAEGEMSDFMTDNLDSNLLSLGSLLNESGPDLIVREIAIDNERYFRAAIVYLNKLANLSRINEEVVRPLSDWSSRRTLNRIAEADPVGNFLKSGLLTANPIRTERSFSEAVGPVFHGDTILLVDGLDEMFIIGTRGNIQRDVGIPETEISVRGPRESFVESIETNMALLRRRISHPDLKAEVYEVGRKTKTNVVLVYLKGVVNEKIVDEIKRRLGRIQTDGILGAGYIEQFISDTPFSLFSTVDYSERPDVVAGKILEGRAALLIDGSPEVLTAPALLIESFQSPDDYNFSPAYATLIRWIRYIAFGISILGPAVYVALSSFNQELIPTPLFITMASGAQGTPYPTFVEVIIIGLFFEIFREAGIHLPRPLGPGIMVAVAFVLAQAPVTMGLVGVATVVTIALTAMASLVTPKQANISILIRLFLVVLASILGAYGILLGLLAVIAYIVSLRSFGAPYLAPIAPFNLRDFNQDVIRRAPLWAMLTRPRTIGWHNSRRQDNDLIPTPPPIDKDDGNSGQKHQ